VYIATANCAACDSEMTMRIEAHQKRRGDRFELIEAPYDITGPLSRLKNRTVLVDCLTLHLSNRLLATEEYLDMEELIESDQEYLEDLHKIIIKNELNVIFVSNEVGLAPVEMNKLGRFFQDLQGRWNRIVADYADEVYSIQAGIPTRLKKKNRCPFKISAPSYLLPTGYIENVTYLIDKVEDIQLLLFDSLPDDPLFNEDTLSTLHYLVKEPAVTFSVHMPTRPDLFAGFESQLERACLIIERLKRLPVSSYTFHYDTPNREKWETLSQEDIRKIDDEYINYFKAIKKKFPNIDISLENTGTPLSALDNVVSACDISYCIDIGHLLVQDRDVSEVEPRLKKASVIHFHGWEEMDGKRQDHRPIRYDQKIFKMLESFTGVLTIENYHKHLFERSANLIKDYF
ncbi:MAG: hypothetical protein GY940_13275, partial [bacterium]|nr:hypothetical protein [bacterium]